MSGATPDRAVDLSRRGLGAWLRTWLRTWLEPWLNRLWWQPEPTRLAWLLWPLSMLYLGLWLVYRHTRPLAKALPVPVLVVGNHVVGGAGKTPTVIAIVQALQRAGHRPGVISRGHGRSGHGAGALHAVHAVHAVQMDDSVTIAGDEPLLVRRRCAVPVWVGRRRADAARALCAAHPEVDVLVSDDGLQHAPLVRSAELVVFDERGAGNGLLLPAGPLREPLPQTVPRWRRVLYTSGASSTGLPGALALRSIASALPLAAWRAGDATAATAATAAVPLSALQGRTLVAVAGIAAPSKFFGMLRAAGLSIEALPLPDHHAYDADSTLPWPANTPDVVTTEKDAVKLDPQRMGSTRVWVVPLDLTLPQTLIDDMLALLFPSALH